jgi:lipopolysaccharide export system protein LptC
MSKLYGLALIALLFATLTYGIIEWRSAKLTNPNTIDSELVPDFIAETLNSNIYNKNGKLSYGISANRMEHYADLAVTYFEYPKYTLYPKTDVSADEQSSPWQISAKEGTLYSNNRVILENRVKLISTDKNSLIQEIHGKHLELDLKTNIISSEQTILIQGKGFTMYGSGLIVDLNSTKMILTEHVQTIYKKTS